MDKTPVSHIMTKEVVVANLFNRFSQVRKLFLEYDLHHLPVTDKDKIIGIISSSDVMKIYSKKLPKDQPATDEVMDKLFFIKDIMTVNPITIAPNDTVEKAAEILSKKRFQSLPVVEDGRIVGILTTRDLVKFLVRLYEQDKSF